MFVRKKQNTSGSISVQVVDKGSGRYKILKTMGSSSDADEVDRLIQQGHAWISEYSGQTHLDFNDEKQLYSSLLSHIQQVTIAGTDLLLGNIYEEVGFNQIEEDLLRMLVLARLCYPVSKLKTTEYLRTYHGVEVSEDMFYRYMDKLHAHHMKRVQELSYQHTRQILGAHIHLVFYDVTTLYFEIDREDDLRKNGFSKDGRHQNPQIVLGLLVSIDGYPLAYDIFEGNKFEGHTMLPVLDEFKERYNIDTLIIVADSGLLSKANITELEQKGYEFILGARIKNEPVAMQERIFALNLADDQSAVLTKANANRLIITYSDKRAQKDAYNRKKGLEKLEKRVKNGKLTKANINNRGYNKYLRLEGNVRVSIDKQKFEADARWDGLKGFVTNSKLPKQQVIDNYKQLWKIEKAFRIAKTDLKIRPIYHRLQPRIEAHICIAFMAYKIYKELERQLKEKGSEWSPEKAIDIAKTIYSITLTTPLNNHEVQQTLILNEEQKELSDLFKF